MCKRNLLCLSTSLLLILSTAISANDADLLEEARLLDQDIEEITELQQRGELEAEEAINILDAIEKQQLTNEEVKRLFTLVDTNNTPYSKQPRANYGVTLGGGKGVLISPYWVLTASHVITWKHQKNPGKNLSIRFAGRGNEQFRGKKVFRHPYKDLALVQLQQPILAKRQPLVLMSTPLKRAAGKIKVKKVAEGQRVWKDIPARSGRYQNFFVSKKQRKGKAGTSGSPWVIESSAMGDVLVSITHGTGRAPQIAYSKRWIQKIISENTPAEKIYWTTFADALPKRFKKK